MQWVSLKKWAGKNVNDLCTWTAWNCSPLAIQWEVDNQDLRSTRCNRRRSVGKVGLDSAHQWCSSKVVMAKITWLALLFTNWLFQTLASAMSAASFFLASNWFPLVIPPPMRFLTRGREIQTQSTTNLKSVVCEEAGCREFLIPRLRFISHH